MNQTFCKPNEFILRVLESGTDVRFELVNPHVQPGADGVFDGSAFMAGYAVLALAGKIKRVKRKVVKEEEENEEEE